MLRSDPISSLRPTGGRKPPQLATLSGAANSTTPSAEQFLALLNSNNVPTNEQVTLLRKDLVTSEHLLAKYRNKLTTITTEQEQLLQKLKADLWRSWYSDSMRRSIIREKEQSIKRQTTPFQARIGMLQSRIRDLRTILSTIRRLPAEILSEILRASTVAEESLPLDLSCRKRHIAPWRFAHVCRFWRETALGDPHLWSRIQIIAHEMNWEKQDLLFDLRAQIRLSGEVSLSVVLDLRYVEEDDEDQSIDYEILMDVLRVLLPSSNRWSRFTLRVENLDYYFPLLSGVQNQLHRLDYLRLEGWHRVSEGENLELFENTPRLRQVDFSSLHLIASYNDLGIEWRNLTWLELSAEENTLLDILSQIPDLVKLGIGNVESFGPLLPRENISLEKLLRLTIRDSSIIQYLTTPTLEHLHFMNGNVEDIQELVHRSRCCIRTLDLDFHGSAFYHDPANVVLLLQNLPQLDHLSLNDFYEKELLQVVPALIVNGPGHSKPLCPNLSTIRVELKGSIANDMWTSLCEMIESRWNVPPDCPRLLQRVCFQWENHLYPSLYSGFCPSESARKRLAALRDQGLYVEGMDAARRRIRA
ncbi:hypothetical protein R3P38DRAFT_3512167 [Favolaschia claudopus]|uniref:F-box domain-containing protein n=1 Tax=Favolaschia claudopus TaxID=2862362 RepID=A0AAV9Z0K8_9AGAR